MYRLFCYIFSPINSKIYTNCYEIQNLQNLYFEFQNIFFLLNWQNQSLYFGLIGDKICWSDKEQPVFIFNILVAEEEINKMDLFYKKAFWQVFLTESPVTYNPNLFFTVLCNDNSLFKRCMCFIAPTEHSGMLVRPAILIRAPRRTPE